MKALASLLALATLSLPTFASLDQAPPAFLYKDAKAVFVDFKSADYEILHNVETKTSTVHSVIKFQATDSGYPIFDLVHNPSEVEIDGVPSNAEITMDPDKESTLRILQTQVEPGEHELRISHVLTNNVVYKDNVVASGFWTSDLTDRRYLEQYLPTNLEFDQYKMNIKVSVEGSSVTHLLKTNGKVAKISENSFEVEYPSFYTASSMYFHLFPEKSFSNNVQFYYPSIDGRMIPVDIYTSYDIAPFVTTVKNVLAELENDYGPFPHDQLIVYGNAPSGGMEYSGATATALGAVGHELFHSYHARCLMPANGNAGWMDEAIARWRDNKYPLSEKLFFESTKLAGHSVWTRKTDRMAYTEGSAFLSWVAYRMNEKGLSFKTFLREYFEKYKKTTVTTPLFQRELTEASGLNLSPDFDKYIYGKGSSFNKSMKRIVAEDPNHPQYTQDELTRLTLP